IDGVAAGLAPGVLTVPAGERTVSLRAPRYVDYATTLTIQGAGVRQDLRVRLQSAWGTLTVTAVPQGAHVSVDGVDSGAAPLTVAAPSGVRRIRIAAAGWKTWESSVVLRGGERLAVGPVTLGQPDAHLSVRSARSEERRVGKECRPRWLPHHEKEKGGDPGHSTSRTSDRHGLMPVGTTRRTYPR